MNYTEVTDHHVRTMKKTRLIYQIVTDLNEGLANDTEPEKIAFVKKMLTYWEDQFLK